VGTKSICCTVRCWASIQRWVMGTVLAGLAVRILLEHRR
ncbi:hypothetical protein ACFMI7_20805, partial [Acinetobacter baumannii]